MSCDSCCSVPLASPETINGDLLGSPTPLATEPIIHHRQLYRTYTGPDRSHMRLDVKPVYPYCVASQRIQLQSQVPVKQRSESTNNMLMASYAEVVQNNGNNTLPLDKNSNKCANNNTYDRFLARKKRYEQQKHRNNYENHRKRYFLEKDIATQYRNLYRYRFGDTLDGHRNMACDDSEDEDDSSAEFNGHLRNNRLVEHVSRQRHRAGNNGSTCPDFTALNQVGHGSSLLRCHANKQRRMNRSVSIGGAKPKRWWTRLLKAIANR